MVRTTAKSSPEGKKDAYKKTTPASPSMSKGKKSETGIWPCKMDGCNREFAREADLKRHQRTTKSHTQPSFSCPQCDAKFTRTDALRRHQKSRHNGIIIETSLPDKGKGLQTLTMDDVTSNGGSPESKAGQGVFTPLSPASLAQFSIPCPPPPGYYRQNGMHTEYLVFIPARALMEGTGLSNPAAPQGQWMPLPPNWSPSGHIPVSFEPTPGVPAGFFTPTFYRPMPDAPEVASMIPLFPPSGQAPEGGAPNGETQSGNMEQHGPEGAHGHGQTGEASGSVIDPNLQANGHATIPPPPHPHPHAPPHMGMTITQAAIHAVMMAAQRDQEQYWLYHNLQAALQLPPTPIEHQHQHPQHSQPQPQPQPQPQTDPDADADGDPDDDLDADGEMDVEMDENEGQGSIQHNHRGGHRHLPQMLTEDGEPMLNPAELLTQESLASPPAS
ncbi:hypothetical protein OF83DRAFT_359421 [Amylostereum chailletii]|nr:hypothetical protein OF83DRAFT_359421 [Amylostereum chailletii]